MFFCVDVAWAKLISRETKDSKVTRETSIGRCRPDPERRSKKRKKQNGDIITQRRKENKHSEHLENERPDQRHYINDKNCHELKHLSAND